VEYASNYLQAASSVPSGLLLAMPFFVTVIVLVIYSVAENNLRKARSMSLQKKARAS
jgi:ABC-type uncharacterized transport system permease subunit